MRKFFVFIALFLALSNFVVAEETLRSKASTDFFVGEQETGPAYLPSQRENPYFTFYAIPVLIVILIVGFAFIMRVKKKMKNKTSSKVKKVSSTKKSLSKKLVRRKNNL